MTGAITDFNQYAGLRLAAENKDPAVLREVAGQFEALFIQTLMKNMREASLGDPLFGDSDQHEMYQEMMDQQLSVEMASGKGIGLAEMLVRQLGGDATPTSSRHATAPFAAALEKTGSKIDELWSDAKSFAAEVWPHAQRIAKKLDVAPEGILAQVALETGWGQKLIRDGSGISGNNLFGIKADTRWDGESVKVSTLEYEKGSPYRIQDDFRAYTDLQAGFKDYVDFLKGNPRYEHATRGGLTPEEYATSLQDAGYATDPRYAEKIKDIVESPRLNDLVGQLKIDGDQPI